MNLMMTTLAGITETDGTEKSFFIPTWTIIVAALVPLAVVAAVLLLVWFLYQRRKH